MSDEPGKDAARAFIKELYKSSSEERDKVALVAAEAVADKAKHFGNGYEFRGVDLLDVVAEESSGLVNLLSGWPGYGGVPGNRWKGYDQR